MMVGAPNTLRSLATAVASSSSKRSGLVLGCGSNVMDLFFPTRKLPQPGEKQYFAAESCMTDSVVGGVTLNHLSWARALGAPTGLLALQGTDTNGQTIRAKMAQLGVSTEYVRVNKEYSTSVSHILLEPSGERTIIMAPASTSRITKDLCAREFGQGVAKASLLTTEISQVPLSGVEYLLATASAAGVPTLLDVDVTPATAVGPAQLGDMSQLRACVLKADCLKLTASAAGELLACVAPGVRLESTLENVAQQLADVFNVRLCVVTDGSRGSALAMGGKRQGKGDKAQTSRQAVTVPIYSGVTQKDATGAGDAFFGGIIAGVHAWGFPTDSDALVRMGSVAAASGAACVEVVGALPVPGVSSPRILALCPSAAELVQGAAQLDAAKHKATHGAFNYSSSTAPSFSTLGAFMGSLKSDSATLSACSDQYSGLKASGSGSLGASVGIAMDHLLQAQAGAGASALGTGHVYCTGMGKSGSVAARMAISLRSVGLRASFTSAAEWVHGDLGALQSGDTVLALSHSGRTAELVGLIANLKVRGVALLAITGDSASPLALNSAAHFLAPVPLHAHASGHGELLGAVPSRSIVAQEAVCNALLSAVVQATGLSRSAFKANHPGGSIGASTASVHQV